MARESTSQQQTRDRITAIRAFQPATPGAPTDWRTQLGQIIVQVETESGLVGVGVGGGGAAGIHVINTVLHDLLIGRDAAPVEELYHAMYDHTNFYGRKGLVIMTISGVDLALWDLRGKRAGVPVAKLLNPRVDLAASLPTYETIFHEEELESALGRGSAAIKLELIDFGDQPDMQKIIATLRRIRARLGAQKELMVDAFAMWDRPTAIRFVQAAADLGLGWLEEPVAPDDYEGYAAVVRATKIPIAGGEHEYTEKGFRDFMKTGVRVLQPDINWCGGLTPVVEIYRMAKAAGLRVVPHRGAEPFSVHAIAALSPQPLAESGRPWFRMEGAPQIENGRIRLNDKPGFGVEARLLQA